MKRYSAYNYSTLMSSGRTMQSMRTEYSKLRKIARERIGRLQKNDLQGYSTNIDAFVKVGFPKVRQLGKDESSTAQALAAVSQFLENPMSTVRGMKEKISRDIDIFKDYFEDPEVLNPGNIREFFDFLEEFRAATKGQMYSSEFVFSVWEASEKSGISKKSLIADVEYWSEHKQDLQAIPERTNKQKISSYQAKRMLAAAKKKTRR